MAYSKCLITRTNWALSGSFSTGSWLSSNPLSNMTTPRAQEVAQASSASSSNTKFDCDLGSTRKVGLIEFQNIVTTNAGTIRVRAGTDATFASTNYDSTAVSSWPLDSSPWGDGATKYSAAEYAALGYPRFFIPSATIDCRYIRVEVVDTGASPALQIGHFGAWEVWEFSYDAEAFSITPADEAAITVVPFGSMFKTDRFRHRTLKLTFQAIDPSTDFYNRLLQIAVIKGQSEPLCIVPMPTIGSDLERVSVWGRFLQPPELKRNVPFWSVDIVFDQMV